jgi:Protein of unknown function (DUF4230)
MAADQSKPTNGSPDDPTVRQPARRDANPTRQLPAVDTGTGWPDDEDEGDDRPIPTQKRRRPDEEYYYRPRRRFSRSRLLFWLAGFVVIVVVLGLVLKVAGLLPHFTNPFAERTTDRSQPTLLLSIQDLSRFEAASGTFQEVIDVQKDHSFIPDIIFNDRTLFVCVGTVNAYVDFSQIGQGAITETADHTTVSVKLPAAQLERANIDHDNSYVFAAQQGIANKIGDLFGGNPNKEQELYQLGAQRIDEAAKSSGLTQRAEDNTKQMLVQMLRSLGYSTITVTFPNP